MYPLRFTPRSSWRGRGIPLQTSPKKAPNGTAETRTKVAEAQTQESGKRGCCYVYKTIDKYIGNLRFRPRNLLTP
jgi:hypothetical protein